MFFIIIAGLFWKRNSTVALTIVLCSWIINCAWSIGPIKQIIVAVVPGATALENAHITAIVAFVLTLLLYSFTKNNKPALFSATYKKEQALGGAP